MPNVEWNPRSYPTQRVAPVGLCLYCWRRDVPLTEEHAIPFGLGGHLILPKATCAECQKVTSLVERRVLRDMWGTARNQLNIRSRRKRDRRKSIAFETPAGDTVSAALADVPALIPLPIFPEPGILAGREGAPGIGCERIVLGMIGTYHLSVPTRTPPIDIDVRAFARFLAKAAHCLAFIELRDRPVTPWLPNLVLAKSPELGHLIGVHPLHQLEPDGDQHHMTGVGQLGNMAYALIRLFAFIPNSPTYFVAVGVFGDAEAIE